MPRVPGRVKGAKILGFWLGPVRRFEMSPTEMGDTEEVLPFNLEF
jgi:hypothetical protein